MSNQRTTIDFFREQDMLCVLYENINKLKFTQDKTQFILNNTGRGEDILNAITDDGIQTKYTRVLNMYYVDGSVLSCLLKDYNPTTNEYNKKTISVSYKNPTNCEINENQNSKTNKTKSEKENLQSVGMASFVGAFTGCLTFLGLFVTCAMLHDRR